MAFKNKAAVFFAICLSIILLLPVTAFAEDADKKAVIITINRLSLQELNEIDTPNIDRLIEGGSISLMNLRTAGSRNSPNCYATIGAGKHIVSSTAAGRAFNTASVIDSWQAGNAYTARTGKNAPEDGVVTLGIPEIKRNNQKENITSGPGLLGETLNKTGLKTAVLGNADIEEEFNRDAVTIAMDSWGRVDYGDVSRDLAGELPGSPIGFKTDYDKLLQRFKEIYSRADLIVVETGDTYRIERASNYVFPEILEAEHKKAVKKADEFIGSLLEWTAGDDLLLMVVSPAPSMNAMAENNLMAPLIVHDGSGESGLLKSGTTQREGITANTDIAPTILRHFDISIPSNMSGRVISTIPHPEPVSQLTELNEDLVFIYNARPVLVKGYIFLQLAIMITVIAAMLLWPRMLRYLRPLLLWLMAVPLSLLLIAVIRFVSLPVYTGIAALLAALIVLGAYRIADKRDTDLFIILGLATAVLIFFDILTGASMIKYSTLGYDAMSGARYYGIGNEFMGVVLGSSIIGTAALWERAESRGPALKIATIVFFAAAVFIMGAPNLGTNIGGTIAAIAAYIFTYLNLSGIKVGIKQLAAIGGTAAGIIFLLALFDMGRAPELQTHLGRTANLVRHQGVSTIWEIIQRKVGMNIKLIRYTIWSRVFLVMLGALAVAFHRPVGLMNLVRRRYTFIFRGLLGILVGSGVVLVVNDSGIVAAATMMIFGVAPLIYLISREREEKLPSK